MPAISETIPADTDDVSENVSTTTLTVGGGSLYWGEAGSFENAGGVRFTSIGPSASDTIDDANLRFGIQANTGDADDLVDWFVDIGSSAVWANTTNTPSTITQSTAKTSLNLSERSAAANQEIDFTALLQEWVNDGDYDGDVRFAMRMISVTAYNNWQVSDTGATWSAVAPTPMVLEGNYTAGGVAVRRNLIFY